MRFKEILWFESKIPLAQKDDTKRRDGGKYSCLSLVIKHYIKKIDKLKANKLIKWIFYVNLNKLPQGVCGASGSGDRRRRTSVTFCRSMKTVTTSARSGRHAAEPAHSGGSICGLVKLRRATISSLAPVAAVHFPLMSALKT